MLILQITVVLVMCIAPCLIILGLLAELANLGIQMMGDAWLDLKAYLREYDV